MAGSQHRGGAGRGEGQGVGQGASGTFPPCPSSSLPTLPPSATTSSAAIVIGYSRLMGEIEAGTLAVLMAHSREIDSWTSQYNGRTIWLRIMEACDDLLAKKRLEGAVVH